MARNRLLALTLGVAVALPLVGAPSARAGTAKSTWRATSRARTVTDIVTVTLPDTARAGQTVSVSMTSSVTDTPTSCDQPDRLPAPPPEAVSTPGRVRFVANGVVRGAASMSTDLTGTRTYSTSCHLGSQYAATEELSGSGSLTLPALDPGTYDVVAVSFHDADGTPPSLVSSSGTVVVSAPATTTTTTTSSSTTIGPPSVTATSTVSVPGVSTTAVVPAETTSSTMNPSSAAGAAHTTTSLEPDAPPSTVAPGAATALPIDSVPTAADRIAGGRSGLAMLGLVMLVGLLLVGTMTRALGREADSVDLATALISNVQEVTWSLLDVDPVSKPDDDLP